MSTTTKRIKRVFSNYDQVLHLWANQSQSDARCKNAFFEGTKVWSYGKHYLLGELVKYKGQTVALINNHKCSNTTSKQIYAAHSATAHLPCVSVSRENWSVLAGLKTRRQSLLAEMEKQFKRLKFWNGELRWGHRYNHVRTSIVEFNELCDKLKEKKFKIKVTRDYIARFNAHIKARAKRNAELNNPEEQAKRREKREKLALAKAAKEITAWRSGGALTKAVRDLSPQLLRVNGSKVETSRGASVSLSEALTAARNLSKLKPGDKIGYFSFAAKQQGIVQVGCHTFSIDEIKTILQPPTLKAVGE